ncbi:site-2 protease family protein, partial [Streptomyces sp. TRM76130]|nr:site-2 protease family protein [Streptomyces sp. TRM76130]
AILNSLPVPGLDGYGVIEPWLSYAVRRQLEPFAQFGLLFVFALLWVPALNGVFFDVIDAVLRWLGIGDFDSYCGFELYRFWQTAEVCAVGA